MLLLKARKASACSGGYRGGPPLFLDQTEALTSKKNFWRLPPPPAPHPHLRIWMTTPSPPTYLRVWIPHWLG